MEYVLYNELQHHGLLDTHYRNWHLMLCGKICAELDKYPQFGYREILQRITQVPDKEDRKARFLAFLHAVSGVTVQKVDEMPAPHELPVEPAPDKPPTDDEDDEEEDKKEVPVLCPERQFRRNREKNQIYTPRTTWSNTIIKPMMLSWCKVNLNNYIDQHPDPE